MIDSYYFLHVYTDAVIVSRTTVHVAGVTITKCVAELMHPVRVQQPSYRYYNFSLKYNLCILIYIPLSGSATWKFIWWTMSPSWPNVRTTCTCCTEHTITDKKPTSPCKLDFEQQSYTNFLIILTIQFLCEVGCFEIQAAHFAHELNCHYNKDFKMMSFSLICIQFRTDFAWVKFTI